MRIVFCNSGAQMVRCYPLCSISFYDRFTGRVVDGVSIKPGPQCFSSIRAGPGGIGKRLPLLMSLPRRCRSG